jgi:acyl-homoserine lactone acylase PvdQ
VTIVRDQYGVAHVYAETPSDLFFAQGYAHAQDRFWEMELNRRRGHGTLGEVLGGDALTVEEGWQSLDLSGVADQELTEMDADSRDVLEAYAAGVNSWLETNQGRLPFEFALLSWHGRPMNDPTPWTAEDSLIVSLVLCWQVGAPRIHPSIVQRIIDRVGPQQGAFLLNGENERGESPYGGKSLQAFYASTDILPDRWPLGSQFTMVDGAQTGRGAPLLAVDLPTGLSIPSPWYVMSWHVGEDGAAGPSVPGVPGLVAGIDDNAVWANWSSPQYAVLSLLKELAPGERTLPWQRWLLAALLDGGRVVHLGGEQPVMTVENLQERQKDVFSARAATLIPLLVQVEPKGWRQERVTGMLRQWDYRVGDNNKEAPFFVVYQLELARAAFADELGGELFEAYVSGSDLYQTALDQIIRDPSNEWWDDVTTAERELRADILERAYEPALEWIGRNYGDLHVLWEWDIVHGSRLHHPLGDAWPWDQLLSRDLQPDGWSDTINASPGSLPCLGGICQGGDLFRAKAVYGYRQIADASDPSVVWFMLLPGQSGHPFHSHYADLQDNWMKGRYLPLRLSPSPDRVDGVESVLVLTPED